MIRFENVSCEYEKGQRVLEGLNLTIEDGQSLGLIGANGAGKSTILKTLLGLLPYEGSIYVDDLVVNGKNIVDIRKKLGFVLQNSDNQMFMPTVFEDMIFGQINYGASRQDAERKVDEVLGELDIEYLKHRYNHKLSGGEKRMAAIATILAMEPSVVLMDEPSSALDPFNRRKIINTINAMDSTKVITSHDLDLIYDTCERVVLIYNGQIVADADKDAILKDKALLEANKMELPLRFCDKI